MKKLILIVIFFSLMLTGGCQQNKKNVYKICFQDNMKNKTKIYNLSISTILDTTKFSYFIFNENDTINLYIENLIKKDNSIFIEGSTELKFDIKKGTCYKTMDYQFFDDSVKVCLIRKDIDSLINDVLFTYNVYEIYYSEFKMPDLYDARLFFDIEKKIFIRKEYFQNDFIIGEEYIIKN